MERCSVPSVKRETPIKTTVRHHYTTVRMAKRKETEHTKCRGGCGKSSARIGGWREWQMAQPLWRTVWQFLKLWKIHLPGNPVILLSLSKRNEHICLHRDTSVNVHSDFICNSQMALRWVGKQQEHTHALKRNEPWYMPRHRLIYNNGKETRLKKEQYCMILFVSNYRKCK